MKTALRQSLIALAAALLAFPLSAQPPTERDWGETLRTDAQALHDLLAEHHPGQVDVENPAFAQNNTAQLALALERAENVESYGDYFFALRIYVSSFNDGHLTFGAFGATPNNFRWPGFITRNDGTGLTRVSVSEELPLVPVGAILVGCDGMTAQEYGSATLGKMWGRWFLEAQRKRFGGLLFLDESSSYIPIAQRCTFEHSDRRWDVALDWKPADLRAVSRLAFGDQSTRPEFGMKETGAGVRWFSMPSFNGNPDAPPAAELTKMIDVMRKDREALSASKAVILDLRGNGGGSSDWSYQMAKVLWGEAAIADLPARNHYSEWRVSQDNLDHLTASYEARLQGGGITLEPERYFQQVISGLTEAIAQGDSLWRHGGDGDDNGDLLDTDNSPAPIDAPIYVVTDTSCMSACLDAMDLWLELGAIHIGLPTSADTNYLEIRRYRLPSGIVGGSLPLKVHRNRARGSNEALFPVERFDGDISDDDALEAWAAQIIEEHAAATSE